MNDTYDFLRALKLNNEREWFFNQLGVYEHLYASFERKIDEQIKLISSFDPSVSGLTGRDCTRRIYKDITRNESGDVFNTSFEAFIAKGGKKSPYCGYFIHIEPDNSYIGGGLWAPDTILLQQLRRDVYEHFAQFQQIIQEPVISSTYSHFDRTDMLDKVPDQFPSNFERGDLLRLDTYRVIAHVDDTVFLSDTWHETLAEKYKCLLPLHAFINSRVENYLRLRF